jgi:hypothetical protein
MQMKSEIKNIHNEPITLFAKIEGVEKQVNIPAGESIIVDTYDTKTIRVFRQRGFVTMNQIPPLVDQVTGEINLKYNASNVDEDVYLVTRDTSNATFDSTTDSNNDEPMDQFHTTEAHEAIVIDEDMKYFQENLMKSLTKEENPVRFEVKSNDENPSILEIVEGEVEQYVEGGFVKGEWTEEDIAFLKKNYPTKGRKYCSTHLNRNESSVQKKINALGLKKKKKKK